MVEVLEFRALVAPLFYQFPLSVSIGAVVNKTCSAHSVAVEEQMRDIANIGAEATLGAEDLFAWICCLVGIECDRPLESDPASTRVGELSHPY